MKRLIFWRTFFISKIIMYRLKITDKSFSRELIFFHKPIGKIYVNKLWL
jgi:hypothetical protein